MPQKDPKAPADRHPGMMGDQTEEQNLDQPGDPAARITREEVEVAFGKDKPEAGAGTAPPKPR